MDGLIARHLRVDEIVSIAPLPGGDLNESVTVTLANGDGVVARGPLPEPSPWAPSIEGKAAAHRIATSGGVTVPEIVASEAGGMIYRYVPGQVISPGRALGVRATRAETRRW